MDSENGVAPLASTMLGTPSFMAPGKIILNCSHTVNRNTQESAL